MLTTPSSKFWHRGMEYLELMCAFCWQVFRYLEIDILMIYMFFRKLLWHDYFSYGCTYVSHELLIQLCLSYKLLRKSNSKRWGPK